MTALADGEERTVLLLLPKRQEMYPLSTAALTRAQNSRRKLASEYRDAFLLDRDGSLRRVEQVDVLGPWGDSAARRLLSRLTDAWKIQVRLSEPLRSSLDELKEILIKCVASRQSVESLQLDGDVDRRGFVDSVRAAGSVKELFDVLNLPAPEDALDVL